MKDENLCHATIMLHVDCFIKCMTIACANGDSVMYTAMEK